MKGFPRGSGFGPFLFNVGYQLFFIRICTLCNYAYSIISTRDADREVVKKAYI